MSSRSIGQLSFSRVIRRVSLTLAVTLGALSLNATAANATDPVWTTVSAQLTDTQSMSASDDGSHILVSSWSICSDNIRARNSIGKGSVISTSFTQTK
ncbi:MAG: hypothetical protein WCO64_07455 [Actinomycetes bacterium]